MLRFLFVDNLGWTGFFIYLLGIAFTHRLIRDDFAPNEQKARLVMALLWPVIVVLLVLVGS